MLKKVQTGILITLCCATFSSAVFANTKSTKYLEDANIFYQDYLKTKDNELLEKAYLNYFKATQIEPTSSSYLGMGMVFIEKKMNRQAKNYLYKAYSIDENDPTTNYYLALFSFNNCEYLRALEFYKRAYERGLAQNYDVNLKMGTIYEKVGDIDKAKKHYETASSLNSNDPELKTRLESLNSLQKEATDSEPKTP